VKYAFLILLLASNLFGATVVLMPLDNVSGEQAVPVDLQPLIVKEVEAKGWHVAGGEDIEALLEQQRVRYLDSLDKNVRDSILAKSGASAILMVTVYKFAQSRNSTVALSGHLIDSDGTITWADIAGVAASDTERALGFGRKDDVVDIAAQAVNDLMREFPSGGQAPRLSRAKSGKRVVSYVSPDLDRNQPIAVLPFDNDTKVSDASRILADSFALRLAGAGFQVVDPAVLRAAALQAGVSFHAISSQDLAVLAKIIGTPLFLRGTIYSYVETGTTPSIDVEATLVDASVGKVLWAAQNNRNGADYVGFLMLGAISNSISLTDRVAAEMVATARNTNEHSNRSADRAALAASRGKSRQHVAGTGESER